MQEYDLKLSKGTTKWLAFESLEEMAYDYETTCINRKWITGEKPSFLTDRDNSFYGDSPKKTLEMVTTGWDSGAKESDKIIEKINESLKVESSAYRSINTVVGSTVNIGAYLAGNPASMRLRKKVLEDTNPINIVLDVTVSQGTDHKEIFNRGVAVLALTRIISSSRPVNLQVITGMRTLGSNLVMTIPIDTSPMDLARASYILTRPEVFRRIMFAQVAKYGEENSGRGYDGEIKWLFSDYSWQSTKFLDEFSENCGWDGEYIAVSGTVHEDSSDGQRGSIEQATAWVMANAKRLLKVKGED